MQQQFYLWVIRCQQVLLKRQLRLRCRVLFEQSWCMRARYFFQLLSWVTDVSFLCYFHDHFVHFSFVCPFICLFVFRSFIQSINRSFFNSFIRSFVHSSIHQSTISLHSDASCSSDSACQSGGDTNKECSSGSCVCKTGFYVNTAGICLEGITFRFHWHELFDLI